MFFCKRVISVATLLFIIHMTMYILSLLQQNPCHKTIMVLFSHTTIKCCFGRKTYSKCCIIIYLSLFSTYRGMMQGFIGLFIWYCSSPITPFLLVWYKAIGICSGIIWESERRLKPLKPPFSLGRPIWYLFQKVFFAEFGFHLGKIRELNG